MKADKKIPKDCPHDTINIEVGNGIPQKYRCEKCSAMLTQRQVQNIVTEKVNSLWL